MSETPKHIKLLVTGSNGQLGQELKHLADSLPQLKTVFTDREELDITDDEAVKDFVWKGEFSHIINCAAYTAVDRAESEPDLCHAINVVGAKNLAEVAKRHGVALIHISTDFVFDGSTNTPYKEEDPTAPLSVYGKTKRDSEKAVLTEAPCSIVIRTGWLYSSFGHNFVKTIMKLARQGKSLKVVDDQTGTPTYARDLASLLLRIVTTDRIPSGIYHYSNLGQTTWHDFAAKIMEYSSEKSPLSACSTVEYGAPAQRPAFSVLDKSKIMNAMGVDIPQWDESLQKCIALMNSSEQNG